MSYTYHTAEIQMEDLEADTLEKRISKNMNDHCETNVRNFFLNSQVFNSFV